MQQKLELLKLLADGTRLKILNGLLKSDSYVEKLAIELSLTPATICYHLKKLENAGVVNCSRSQFYIIYSLNREIFNKSMSEFITLEEPIVCESEKYRKEVVSRFFKYGRLVNIPSQQKKREIVLEEIAKAFLPNKAYTETEVNGIIHRFHDDHCTIRRDMIAFKLLERENDIYTRI